MTAFLKRFNIIALVLGAMLLGSIVTGTTVAAAYQGHMYAAQNQLGFALNQLNLALADKAGHRAQAIVLVKEARTQVQLGIAAGAR
jgi:hypothetical protein